LTKQFGHATFFITKDCQPTVYYKVIVSAYKVVTEQNKLFAVNLDRPFRSMRYDFNCTDS